MNSRKADIILHAPAVFNTVSGKAEPLSLALKGPFIQATGSKRDMEGLSTPETEVIDLKAGLVLPGFHDFHAHIFAGSLTEESVDLHAAATEWECAATAGNFAAEHSRDEWIIGFNWYHVFWNSKRLPTKRSLDRYIPDRPAFLLNADYHGAWVNSRALELCGINKHTEDPPCGRIERDESGEPTGFLSETAMGLAGRRAFSFGEEKKTRLFRKFLSLAASRGITSAHDMIPLPGMLCGDPGLYAAFEKKGELSLRIFLEGELSGSLSEGRLLQSEYNSPLLRFSGLKQFVDGVATTYTAFLVEPYSDRSNTRGGTLIPPQELKEYVISADRAGFRVRLHACGDGAVRLALDCCEAAAERNGQRDARHTIEHIETIHPDDFHRFKDLNITASVQPEHLAMTPRFEDSPYRARLGRRREKYLWPNRSFINRNVPLCYGSDFPVVGIDPLKGLYRAVTRIHDDGNPPGGWNPEEKVSLSQALACYTSAGARGSFMENSLGCLRPGCFADIAVLDRNILAGKTDEIVKAKNSLTISNGKIVYRAD